MRLVLDTNVVISALLWRGLPNELLRSGLEDNVRFFTSSPLLAELTDVLSRPKLQRQIVRVRSSVPQLIGSYSASAIRVEPFRIQPIAPDPDDDIVIATALAAQADLIVTGDRTLRSIAQHQGIRIVSVSEALKEIALV
jgi:putative PIN family toxin of toxin-antitoxin system